MSIARPASLQTVVPPGYAYGFNPMALVTIFEPGRQVSVITRPAQVAVRDYLLQVNSHLRPSYRLALRCADNTPTCLNRHLQLPEAEGKHALLTDISRLVDLYAELLGCDTVGIRLEVLATAMCPRLHIDRTGIRMLCTYLGPGTEWLEETPCDTNMANDRYGSLYVSDLQAHTASPNLQQAPEQALVLLKGSLWQGNQHAGALHRSPLVTTAAKRVVLALDALWET